MVNQKSELVKKRPVRHYHVTPDDAGQRIDNLLSRELKGMPKSRIYRLLRKGEVRINKKRVTPSYRVKEGDDIRIPPVALSDSPKAMPPSLTTINRLKNAVIYEDDDVLIINKPAGMSVHAGSTVRMGVIEAMRQIYPKIPHLELVHRLDAGTSGCLILAKRRRVLRELHTLLREGKVKKCYQALTMGKWLKSERYIDVPLLKSYRQGGEHLVKVDQAGKQSVTEVSTIAVLPDASLVAVTLHTGRTHQIRVHAAHRGHPIAGDERYGDKSFNQLARAHGLKRLFLHAFSLDFTLPSTGKPIHVEAPLEPALQAVVMAFKQPVVRK